MRWDTEMPRIFTGSSVALHLETASCELFPPAPPSPYASRWYLCDTPINEK